MKQIICPYCNKPFSLFTSNEQKVLEALKNNTMNFSQLKEATGIFNPPSLARVIISLEKDCLISWVLSTNDRRSKIYSLNANRLTKEEEADVLASEKEIKEGKCKTFETTEEFIADLHKSRSSKANQQSKEGNK